MSDKWITREQFDALSRQPGVRGVALTRIHVALLDIQEQCLAIRTDTGLGRDRDDYSVSDVGRDLLKTLNV